MTGPADPALKIAQAQRNLLGHEAEIAYDTRREGDMPRRTVEHGVPARTEFALATKGGLWAALQDRRLLARAFAEYDVIHAHATHDHGLAVLARSRGARARLVRSVHHPRSLARRPLQASVFARTDALTVVAEAHRALLFANYPSTPRGRVFVMPGAVDPEIYAPSRDGMAFRRSVSIPEDALVFGMIARFQPGRRQEVFIRALADVRARTGLDLWLVLIGKGETQAMIEQEIAAAGLQDRARLYGFRDADLPEAIKSCDVTVLLQEGSDAGCRAVLQSLSEEVPVIGARYAAIEDALAGGALGALVRGDEVAELSAAIEALARQSPEARKNLGVLGRKRILEHHTERARVEALDRIYQLIRSG